MASVDKLLEERFRHIMQDEKWIPQTIGALMGGGESSSSPPVAQQSCDTRKILGGSILAGALLGILIVWYRKES